MFEEKMPMQYEQFQPTVAELSKGLGKYKLLGEGAESKVWQVKLSIGDFAIKIAKQDARNSRDRAMDRGLMTKSKIEGGLRAIGIKGLEQFVVGSIEDHSSIFQFVEGTRLTDFRDDDIDMVTPEQREMFFETIAKATEAGLVFDSANLSGANAFYSPTEGFTLIDYQKAWWQLEYDENWSYAIRSLGPVALRVFAA